MEALKKRIKENPELSHLNTLFEEGNEDMLAMVLDEPKLIDFMMMMKNNYPEMHEKNDEDKDQEEDENDPQFRLQKAAQINNKWFKSNTPINIIKQIRDGFNTESASRKPIGSFINDTVKNVYNFELTEEICNEIELHALSLNDERINIIEINYEIFTEDILSIMTDDINYVENNLLNNNMMNINHCIFTQYLKEKSFKNHNNIINCRDEELYKNTNTELSGNKIKVGDIIHIVSDSMHTGFSDIWYIIDTDNITMRRIGIKSYNQYIQDAHIIIPGFVTEYLLDPIKSYSTLIHHHCWESGGGTIEIELQINKKSVIFNSKYKSLINHMDNINAAKVMASYGWKQKDWSKKYRKNKHCIEDMEAEQYYTMYVKTDAGAYGALIGLCNHPNIPKINLSAIGHTDADQGYIIKYNDDKKNQNILTETEVNALLLNLDSNIKIDEVSMCLKRGIAFGIVVIDEDKGLDTILLNDRCISCEGQLSCTIRDALYQSDYGGNDYRDGGTDAAVQCQPNCAGNYVTGICNGYIKFDSGKFHNHCTECQNMGQCIGDYRNQHCDECDDHYFAGRIGSYQCNNCYPNTHTL